MTADEEALLIRFLLELGELDSDREADEIRADFQDWHVWLRTPGHSVTGECFYKTMLACARVWLAEINARGAPNGLLESPR